jgi:c-di-AMP phosphodiesterase-like protein
MSDRMLTKIVTPYLICAAILFAPGVIFLFSRGELLPPYYESTLHPADYILVICAIAFVAACVIIRLRQRRWLINFIEGVQSEVEDTVRYSVMNHPLPICVVNIEGRLVLTNDRFKRYFPDAKILKTGVKDVIGIDRDNIEPDEESGGITITSGDRSWLVLVSYLNEDTSKNIILYFIDITAHEALKVKYADEKQFFCYVVIDNYDEILSKSKDEKRPAIAASLETAILGWGASLNAIVIRNARHRFNLIFDKAHFRELEAGKFSILDEIRKTEGDADFPASLSIGVGAAGDTLPQSEEYAAFALDLALGRGGDQAVVKTEDDVMYYGGKVQMIDTRNKGKSRVMAHALKPLMAQASMVMVMGHKNMDMDSLGSALGIFRIALAHDKKACVVYGEIGNSMEEVFTAAKRSGAYKFVTCEDAVKIADASTLLVVVDSHTRGMVECPELLDIAELLVIIDHHRKKHDFIDNATLTFMEPGASSASELIAEIMQYDDKVGRIGKLEANLMFAGISVDTNNFSVNTGMRTFEVASWLRKSGADSAVVRGYMQDDMEDVKQRANIISNADFSIKSVAISRNEGVHANAQTIAAKAADELLDIKGIRASFVVGETKKEVVISARSLGSLNVQTIMEKFGGGGHLTMAAAQIPGATQDDVIDDLKEILKEFGI